MKYELNLIEQYKDGVAEGFSEGLSQGLSQGQAEEKRRIVKGFKALGLSDKDIAKGASISVEQVQNILKS